VRLRPNRVFGCLACDVTPSSIVEIGEWQVTSSKKTANPKRMVVVVSCQGESTVAQSVWNDVMGQGREGRLGSSPASRSARPPNQTVDAYGAKLWRRSRSLL
jgi:hypothetical protein